VSGPVAGTAFGRWRSALARTRDALGGRLGELFGRPDAGAESLSDLEDILLTGDVGVAAASELVEQVRRARPGRGEELRAALVEAITTMMGPALPLARASNGTTVWVLVGVNGAGKTTTTGKLAAQAVGRGERVLLAAADTFRAAAAEQLAIWAERAGADIVRGAPGGDPAAVVFDAVKAATARRADLLLVDTAGRLQTKEPLMAELGKVMRVIGRELQGAPHERLLVLDATVGQNALSQARLFGEAAGVTGLVLAKMDSSARAGAALAVRRELGLPVRLVGTGEGIDDLGVFEPRAYAEALTSAGPAAPAG
jgi:fused signal recognition particle receptor